MARECQPVPTIDTELHNIHSRLNQNAFQTHPSYHLTLLKLQIWSHFGTAENFLSTELRIIRADKNRRVDFQGTLDRRPESSAGHTGVNQRTLNSVGMITQERIKLEVLSENSWLSTRDQMWRKEPPFDVINRITSSPMGGSKVNGMAQCPRFSKYTNNTEYQYNAYNSKLWRDMQTSTTN